MTVSDAERPLNRGRGTLSASLAPCIILMLSCKFPELPPIDDDAATDAPVRYTLTLTVDGAGTGMGAIRVEPGGFTCPLGTCMRTFDGGANLTVTVEGMSPVDGVVSVTGDCQASPCALTLDGDKTVTAQFVRYACAPNTETCTSGMYTQCDATGNFVSHVIPNGMNDGTPTTITMDNYACPMGCHASQPRCADITLGNGMEVAMDTPAVSSTGLDVVLPKPTSPDGTINLSTNSFNSTTGTLTITDTDGATMDLPAQLVEQGGEAGAVVVIKARTFTLRAGSRIIATGSRSLGIATHFDSYIGGTLDLSGRWDLTFLQVGAGARTTGASCLGGSLAGPAGATGGGGGACMGGGSSTGTVGGGISAVVSPAIVGGCVGGRGTNTFQFPSPSGGGLLVVSRRRIYFASTAVVDLTGGQGTVITSGGYATGGGSGGNTVLMAPLVRVVSGALIATRGGSGAAASASAGALGSPGPISGSTPAAGATCAGCGTGGTGGYENSCNGGAGTGSGSAIGGGGGAAGHCAFYSLTGGADASGTTTKCVKLSNPLLPRSP